MERKIESELAEKHGFDVVAHVKMIYFLQEMLVTEIAAVRDYVPADYRKMLSEAKAKTNHCIKHISQNVPPEFRGAIDDKIFETLEELAEKVKNV